MPELPDVEIYKKYLDATSLYKKIKETVVTNGKILEGVSARRLAKDLKGRTLKSTRRHGKYLFVEMDSFRWLVLHFGMTGNLAFYCRDRDTPEYGRVILSFTDGCCLAYISRRLLGKVALTGDPDAYLVERGLGPDAASLDLRGFRDALGTRGQAKSTLMNQRHIAGIGNIYSDEILYRAGIYPGRDAGSLTKKETKELYRAMKRIMMTAVKKNADPEKMPRSWLLPLRGSEAKCPLCGGTVRSMKAAGRTA